MRPLLLAALLVAVPAGAQETGPLDRYDRPSRSVTVDLGGAFDFGFGVGVEARLTDGAAIRGTLGRRGGLFGLYPGVAFGAMAVGVGGLRWAEVEAGLGVTVEVGRRADEAPVMPTGYGGVRFSLPIGRDREGRTVPRDLLLRIGAAALVGSERGYGDAVSVYPSLGAGIAF